MRTCVPFELRIVKGKGERFLGWLFCPRWGPGDTEKDTATEYKEPSNQCRLLDHGHLLRTTFWGPGKRITRESAPSRPPTRRLTAECHETSKSLFRISETSKVISVTSRRCGENAATHQDYL